MNLVGQNGGLFTYRIGVHHDCMGRREKVAEATAKTADTSTRGQEAASGAAKKEKIVLGVGCVASDPYFFKNVDKVF